MAATPAESLRDIDRGMGVGAAGVHLEAVLRNFPLFAQTIRDAGGIESGAHGAKEAALAFENRVAPVKPSRARSAERMPLKAALPG